MLRIVRRIAMKQRVSIALEVLVNEAPVKEEALPLNNHSVEFGGEVAE